MSDQPIHLTPQGPPRTVLPFEDAGVRHELQQALGAPADEVRARLADLVARNPRSLIAWQALGDHGRDTIERYAAYRVGYHRGLDALRRGGWKGHGPVPWSHVPNRGFLRALAALGQAASLIGETAERDRISAFVADCDPEAVAALRVSGWSA